MVAPSSATIAFGLALQISRMHPTLWTRSGGDRGDIEAETLLKVVLALVVVWLVLEVVSELLDIVLGVFAFFRPLLGLLVVALIVLWLLDRI
jgi:hypothetical protein